MKTILLAISLALFTLQATGQSFTRSQVYDSLTLTGQNNKVTLFDYDGDGDDDVFSYGGTNDNRILVFENNNGNFDSSFVFYDTGSFQVKDLTLLDYDADGDLDIVGYSGSAVNPVDLLKFENLGSGNFSLTTQPNVLAMRDYIDSADIDGDGLPDLVHDRFQPEEIRWVKNLGGGNFANTFNTITTHSGYFELADIDNDGDIDLITIAEGIGAPNDNIYLNDGNGNFNTTINFSSSQSDRIYTLGDFNGDGLMDIAQAANFGSTSGEINIFWNSVGNNFTSALIKSYPSNSPDPSTTPNAIESFDFDGDGDLDLMVGELTGSGNAKGTVLINDGNQNFTVHPEKISGTRWRIPGLGEGKKEIEMHFSDFDSDGNIDVLTASTGDHDLIVHQQDNTANFLTPKYLNHTFQQINNFQILDYNNDGNNDLVTVDNSIHGKLEVAYGNGNNEFTSSEVLIDNRTTSLNQGGPQLTFWNNNTDYDLVYASGEKVFVHLDFDTPNEEVVLLFTSTGTGSNPTNIGIISSTTQVLTIKDIDNDGDNDLIIPQKSSSFELNNYYWIENTGSTSFTEHVIPSSQEIQRYVLVDVDNDGDLDFIGAKFVGGTTEYEFYSFDAVTKTYTNYLTLSTSGGDISQRQFASGDIDGDGDEDIVISGLMWMENDGAGNFTAPVDLVPGFNTHSTIVIDDVDNDGLLDIITNVNEVQPNRRLVVTLFNQGNNVFTPITQELEVFGGNSNAINVGDFNNDGFKSIVTSSEFNSLAQTPILFNFCINTENTVDVDVCSGDSYTFADGTVQDDITQDVTFVSTLTGQAANGCDVVVTENITVISVSDVTTTTTDETITANNSNATYVWLDCDDNFAVIPGETGQSFTATANGNYAVEITENGCSEISDCVLITTLGLEDNTLSNQINIYPNPTAGDLNIQLGQTYEDVQVIVRNILGQQIITRTYTAVQDLNLNIEANSGLYFIEITTGNHRAVSKVVKR